MKTITTQKPLLIGLFLLSGIMCIIYQSQAQEIINEPTGEGTVRNLTFYCKSLQMDRSFQIYLPQGYDQESNTRYPVIYFLHGAGENHTSEPQLITILNSLIGDNTILPAIVVKPDGRADPWNRSYYTNSDLYGKFEDYIVYDLVEFIDSAYNTINARDKRAIMGWSMGAYGAMKCALKHPDLFCGVAAHAGMLNMRMCSQFIPYILSENGGAPVSAFSPDAGPWSYGAFAIAGAFSPNLDNPSNYVDFPLDSMGSWIDSVWNRWSMQNCPYLAGNLSQEDDLAIYFDCGMQDETLSYLFNSSFADSLDKLDLPYKFESFTGGHDCSGRYPIGLLFLDSVMNGLHTNVEGFNNSKPTQFILYQNHPNPFSSETTIQYRLLACGNVKLSVFDVLGHEVRTLVNENQSQAEYEVAFNAAELAEGIYYYKMQVQSVRDYCNSEIRKLLIIKK